MSRTAAPEVGRTAVLEVGRTVVLEAGRTAVPEAGRTAVPEAGCTAGAWDSQVEMEDSNGSLVDEEEEDEEKKEEEEHAATDWDSCASLTSCSSCRKTRVSTVGCPCSLCVAMEPGTACRHSCGYSPSVLRLKGGLVESKTEHA